MQGRSRKRQGERALGLLFEATKPFAKPTVHFCRHLFRMPIPSAPKRALWRATQHYLAWRGFESVVPTRFGTSIAVRTNDMVQKHIFFFGEWEPSLTRYLLAKKSVSGTFIDLGANIGYFSLLASRVFSNVVAVEASPTIAGLLRGNIERNGAGNVTVHQVAVGETAGFVDFFMSPRDNIGASSVTATDGACLEAKVPMRPFMDIVGMETLRDAAFIKVDIEGCEPSVLRSLRQLRDELRDDIEIVVELQAGAMGDRLWQEIRAMQGAGFSARRLQGAYRAQEYLEREKTLELAELDERPSELVDVLLAKKC